MIHITGRANISRGKVALIKAISILLSLIVCALIIMSTTGENPISVFDTMFKGAFGSSRKMWNFLQSTAILLIISLAVTPAFKMRCWNLGAEGQVLAGSLASAACMI